LHYHFAKAFLVWVLRSRLASRTSIQGLRGYWYILISNVAPTSN